MQVLLVLLHTLYSYWQLRTIAGSDSAQSLLTKAETAYLMGFVPLEISCTVLHPWLLASKLPFLPLLLTSVYCALGISYCWCLLASRWLWPATANGVESLRKQV